MIGSSISSMRTPHITPVMSVRAGFNDGDLAKKVSKSVCFSSCDVNSD